MGVGPLRKHREDRRRREAALAKETEAKAFVAKLDKEQSQKPTQPQAKGK